jgi:UDP-glucose 4-epimerase
MDRVLVTGGAGFIGSHLVDHILDSGARVLVVDDFRLGRMDHLSDAGATGRLTVVKADIRSESALTAIRQFEPDGVFHLAALHYIPYCTAHPEEALDVNVGGLEAVLDALSQAPLRAFVFPSSAAVYGFGDDPFPETSPPRPNDVYGRSKLMGEQLVARFRADRPEVRTVVARVFNAYGPRETNPHVLPEIIAALRERRPIELGNLWPRRDLIFVADAVYALVAAAGQAGSELVNVGTGTGVAIEEVVATIAAIIGRSLEVRQVPERMRDHDGHLVSDPHKLTVTAGFMQRWDLRAGLSRVLESEGLL